MITQFNNPSYIGYHDIHPNIPEIIDEAKEYLQGELRKQILRNRKIKELSDAQYSEAKAVIFDFARSEHYKYFPDLGESIRPDRQPKSRRLFYLRIVDYF